jgi:hypothetical protein
VTPINFKRPIPPISSPEHLLRAAEWALPPLIRWLNPKIIVWALGLMMCEVNISITSNYGIIYLLGKISHNWGRPSHCVLCCYWFDISLKTSPVGFTNDSHHATETH